MPSRDEAGDHVIGPAGFLPPSESYTYRLSQQQPYPVPLGNVNTVAPIVFPIASNFSVGFFTIEPGAMREMHWHLTSDKWNFFIFGSARISIFESTKASRIFDFAASNIAYIPVTDSHYIENVGDEIVVYLEILQAPKYKDVVLPSGLGGRQGKLSQIHCTCRTR